MKAIAVITLIWAGALLLLANLQSTTVYYVDATFGNDNYSGMSWNAAKATINSALRLTEDGDSVFVAEGHYLECISLPPEVVLLGGFPSAGGERNPTAHETIIDGQRQGTVLTTHLESENVVDGFTITGGHAFQGGGIYALGKSKFINLKVINNHADNLGGGFFCGPSVKIINCQINDNKAGAASEISIIGQKYKNPSKTGRLYGHDSLSF